MQPGGRAEPAHEGGLQPRVEQGRRRKRRRAAQDEERVRPGRAAGQAGPARDRLEHTEPDHPDQAVDTEPVRAPRRVDRNLRQHRLRHRRGGRLRLAHRSTRTATAPP